MMFNFPFYPYYHSRYYPINKNYIHSKNTLHKQNVSTHHSCSQNKKLDEKPIEKQGESESVVFNILGLKLYYDDILLICLIFFLYNEGIKDESLFIVLVLLLLS